MTDFFLSNFQIGASKMSKFNTAEFKAKLDDIHRFPTEYMFKFIVKGEKISEVESLFPKQALTLKPSSKGNYTSVTAKLKMNSSDAVIQVYEQAHKIDGIIAL